MASGLSIGRQACSLNALRSSLYVMSGWLRTHPQICYCIFVSLVPSMGFGRTNEYSTVLAMLLPKYRCDYIRGGQCRFGANGRREGRVGGYARGGRFT